MGVVYYSRYFEYFEQGRTELLNSIGLNVSEIENQGIFLPVVLAHCEYNKGARFEDKITIISKINETVVVLPFVPVTQILSTFERSEANSISLITGIL